MFSVAIKHMAATGRILASRVLGKSGGRFKPVRTHYDLRVTYTICEENGDPQTDVDALFPSGTYSAVDYTPTWTAHRFVGWYTTPSTPSATADTSGTAVAANDPIVYGRSAVYARWQLPTAVTFDATTNGGTMPSGWSAPYYYIGQPYGTLPSPTKSGEVFLGWFTSGGSRVTEQTNVPSGGGTLTARYAAVTYATKFKVTTASSNRVAGIYSTTSRNVSNPTVVDWGDGSYDVVYGNISQLAHTYSSNGTFTVGINDSISSLALSTNSSSWYQTTTKNYYIVKEIVDVSTNVTTMPSYAFAYLYYLTSVNMGGNSSSPSSLTLSTYAFYNSMRSSAATVDLSGRRITSISNYCFYYCYYLKNIYWPSGLTSIGSYAFYYCFYYSSSTTAIVIPEGVTSISASYAFGSCYYLTEISLPTTLTSIGNYAFYYCQRLATIRANRTTAPTVSAQTFGSSTSTYTGRASYSTGTNKLIVPQGATGYDAGYWADPLQNSTKCGFALEVAT